MSGSLTGMGAAGFIGSTRLASERWSAERNVEGGWGSEHKRSVALSGSTLLTRLLSPPRDDCMSPSGYSGAL